MKRFQKGQWKPQNQIKIKSIGFSCAYYRVVLSKKLLIPDELQLGDPRSENVQAKRKHRLFKGFQWISGFTPGFLR